MHRGLAAALSTHRDACIQVLLRAAAAVAASKEKLQSPSPWKRKAPDPDVSPEPAPSRSLLARHQNAGSTAPEAHRALFVSRGGMPEGGRLNYGERGESLKEREREATREREREVRGKERFVTGYSAVWGLGVGGREQPAEDAARETAADARSERERDRDAAKQRLLERRRERQAALADREREVRMAVVETRTEKGGVAMEDSVWDTDAKPGPSLRGAIGREEAHESCKGAKQSGQSVHVSHLAAGPPPDVVSCTHAEAAGEEGAEGESESEAELEAAQRKNSVLRRKVALLQGRPPPSPPRRVLAAAPQHAGADRALMHGHAGMLLESERRIECLQSEHRHAARAFDHERQGLLDDLVRLERQLLVHSPSGRDAEQIRRLVAHERKIAALQVTVEQLEAALQEQPPAGDADKPGGEAVWMKREARALDLELARSEQDEANAAVAKLEGEVTRLQGQLDAARAEAAQTQRELQVELDQAQVELDQARVHNVCQEASLCSLEFKSLSLTEDLEQAQGRVSHLVDCAHQALALLPSAAAAAASAQGGRRRGPPGAASATRMQAIGASAREASLGYRLRAIAAEASLSHSRASAHPPADAPTTAPPDELQVASPSPGGASEPAGQRGESLLQSVQEAEDAISELLEHHERGQRQAYARRRDTERVEAEAAALRRRAAELEADLALARHEATELSACCQGLEQDVVLRKSEEQVLLSQVRKLEHECQAAYGVEGPEFDSLLSSLLAESRSVYRAAMLKWQAVNQAQGRRAARYRDGLEQRACWAAWRRATVRAHAQQRRCAAAAACRQQRVLTGSVRSWLNVVHAAAVLRDMKAGLVASIRRKQRLRAAAGCLQQWRQRLADERRIYHLMALAMHRMMHTCLSSVFGGWKQRAGDTRRVTLTSRKLVRRLRHARLGVVCREWQQAAASRKRHNLRLHSILLRVSTRARHGEVMAAWTAWHEAYLARRGSKRVVVKAAMRLQHRGRHSLHAVWSSWRGRLEFAAFCRSALGKASLRRRCHVLAQVFVCWRGALQSARRRRKFAVSVAARRGCRLLSLAWQAWLGLAMRHKHCAICVSKVRARQGHMATAGVFARWSMLCGKARRLNAIRIMLWRRHWSRTLVAFFRAWWLHVVDMKYDHHVQGKAARQLVRKTVYRCFSDWVKSVSESKHIKLATSLVARPQEALRYRCARRLLIWTFRAWFQDAARHGYLMRMQGAMLQRMESRCAAFAFEAWQLWHCKAQQSRALLLRALSRARRRMLIEICRRWARCVTHLKFERQRAEEQAETEHKVAAWTQERDKEREEWNREREREREEWDRERERERDAWEVRLQLEVQQEATRRAVSRWQCRTDVMSILQWLHSARLRAQLRAWRGCVDRRLQHQQTGLKFAAHHAHKVVAASWEQLKSMHRKMRRNRHAASKCVKLLQRFVVSLKLRSFDIWVEHVGVQRDAETERLRAGEQQRLAQEIESVKQQMEQVLEGVEVDVARKEGEVQQLQDQIQRLQLELHTQKTSMEEMEANHAREVATRGEAESRQIEAQLQHSKARRERVLGFVLSRVCQRSISLAMDIWQGKVIEVQEERREQKRRDCIMRKVVNRMYLRILSGAFVRWYEMLAELKNMTTKEAKVKFRAMKQIMKSSFSTWRLRVADNNVMATKALKVIGRWVKGGLARSVHVWHDYAIQESCRRKGSSNMIDRRQRRGLGLTWKTWVIGVEMAQTQRREEDRRQRLLAQTIKRILRRVLVSGFGLWAENVAEMLCNREILNRCLLRMSNRLLFVALDRWCQTVTLLVDERDEGLRRQAKQLAQEQRRQRILASTVTRMLNTTLAAAFSSWCESVLHVRATESKARKALARYKLRLCHGCLNAWRFHTAGEARGRVLLGKIAGRLQHRCIARALSAWLEHVDNARRRSRDLRRIQHNEYRANMRALWALRRMVCGAYDEWCSYVDEVVRDRMEQEREAERLAIEHFKQEEAALRQRQLVSQRTELRAKLELEEEVLASACTCELL